MVVLPWAVISAVSAAGTTADEGLSAAVVGLVVGVVMMVLLCVGDCVWVAPWAGAIRRKWSWVRFFRAPAERSGAAGVVAPMSSSLLWPTVYWNRRVRAGERVRTGGRLRWIGRRSVRSVP